MIRVRSYDPYSIYMSFIKKYTIPRVTSGEWLKQRFTAADTADSTSRVSLGTATPATSPLTTSVSDDAN